MQGFSLNSIVKEGSTVKKDLKLSERRNQADMILIGRK